MATNPYKNKVIYNGNTLIDLTDATATADKILQNFTAYGADGAKLTGTVADGNNLLYGLIDGTLPLVGVAKVGSVDI